MHRIVMAMAVVALLCPAQEPSSQNALGAGSRIPVLLISGADTFHNWRRTTPQMRALLEQSGKFDVRVCEDVHILESREALSVYPVLVFNQQVSASTAAIRANLKEYLQRGGGLVALHWAVDNFHDWPEFADLLGRAWQEGVSGEEHGQFLVHITDRNHPITRGIDDFSTAEAEAIHFRLRGNAPIHVLATANAEDAGPVPVMFTNSPGKGRVFFTPFGHSESSRHNPVLERIILRAVEWAATGDVK